MLCLKKRKESPSHCVFRSCLRAQGILARTVGGVELFGVLMPFPLPQKGEEESLVLY